ncbi:MAG: hypothetical protein LBV52_01355, partial [Spirochaetaceae bacterium]|nr:hypothetical protein [Spirochaetaceae bacterium]
MTRNRKLSLTATYVVSSYVVRTETDLEDDFTQKMFKAALKRAEEKFGFVTNKITFFNNAFSLQ